MYVELTVIFFRMQARKIIKTFIELEMCIRNRYCLTIRLETDLYSSTKISFKCPRISLLPNLEFVGETSMRSEVYVGGLNQWRDAVPGRKFGLCGVCGCRFRIIFVHILVINLGLKY